MAQWEETMALLAVLPYLVLLQPQVAVMVLETPLVAPVVALEALVVGLLET